MTKDLKTKLLIQSLKIDNIIQLMETISSTINDILEEENEKLDNLSQYPQFESKMMKKQDDCVVIEDMLEECETIINSLQDFQNMLVVDKNLIKPMNSFIMGT